MRMFQMRLNTLVLNLLCTVNQVFEYSLTRPSPKRSRICKFQSQWWWHPRICHTCPPVQSLYFIYHRLFDKPYLFVATNHRVSCFRAANPGNSSENRKVFFRDVYLLAYIYGSLSACSNALGSL